MSSDQVAPVVRMVETTRDRATYGVMFQSTYVYNDRTGRYGPVRVVVWDNVCRPNPRDGEPVRYGEYGPMDGGNGKYLDPRNRATDAMVSVLLSPEACVIDAYGTGTGTPGSGQVYDPSVSRLGDALILELPDGSRVSGPIAWGNYGHGTVRLDGSMTRSV